MSRILVVGGGVAGAAAARELAASGRRVLIAEATGAIGGKVRGYGCKATGKCSNCGVCLTKNLWSDVENSSLIDIEPNTKLVDLTGVKGHYTAALKSGGVIKNVNGITGVIVATGFKNAGHSESPHVMTGSGLEAVLKERGATGLFDKAPEKVAFVQCYGSRDLNENGAYCSRVCCAYSTRAAKVIKKYYPDCGIVFFYMEMQQVESGNYFDELKELGVLFIKCRPVEITFGNPAGVVFNDPNTGRRESLYFDAVVLSEGIRPADDAARIAEICGLGQDEAGFLRYIKDIGDADNTGVYIAGCAKGPAKIEEVYADSIAAARRLLFKEAGGTS